jgi:hypothetical protein
VSRRPVRLVLDTTAALAYAHGSVAVGETIGEVAGEGAAFTVPAVCLAEAGAALDLSRLAMLELLVGHPAAVAVDLPDWRALATACRLYGTVTRATAVSVAAIHRAYVLTAEPDAYGGDDVDGVIAI